MNKNEEKLIKIIHKIFRKDPYILALFKSWGIVLDELESKLFLLLKEFLFSTMSSERVKELEKELEYKTISNTLEGKRTEIEARWKIAGKCDIDLLQAIANTWKADTAKVKFTKGRLYIDFLTEMNSDFNFISLYNALNEAKPAHLGLDLVFEEQKETKINLKTFNIEEIEEDFIEKDKTIIEIGQYYTGSMEEVSEEYGI